MNEVEYKIIRNPKYGDYRIDLYLNGQWDNQICDNWTRAQAAKILKHIKSGSEDFYWYV